MTEAQSGSELHPAEHRAYRELVLSSRQLLHRWERLGRCLDDTQMAAALDEGGEAVRRLLEKLEPRIEAYGLHAGPAAHGAGATLAQLRSGVVDRSVDTGLAARLAVLDIEHVTTLLLQLAELALVRGDEEMATFCVEWAKRLRPVVKGARKAAVRLGTDPDRAAAPLDPSKLGQVMHRVGWAVGTLGEWFDRRLADVTGGDDEAESERKPADPAESPPGMDGPR